MGKGTVIKEAMKYEPNLRVSVSATTRPCRAGEQEGKSYFFLSEQEFMSRIKAGSFIEWSIVHHYYYGTIKNQVMNWLSSGEKVILEVDVQGAAKIKKKFPNVISIFIVPPSFEILANRLRNRKTDEQTVIESRLTKAGHELEEIGKYDYIIVNDTVANAAKKILSVLNSLDKDQKEKGENHVSEQKI